MCVLSFDWLGMGRGGYRESERVCSSSREGAREKKGETRLNWKMIFMRGGGPPPRRVLGPTCARRDSTSAEVRPADRSTARKRASSSLSATGGPGGQRDSRRRDSAPRPPAPGEGVRLVSGMVLQLVCVLLWVAFDLGSCAPDFCLPRPSRGGEWSQPAGYRKTGWAGGRGRVRKCGGGKRKKRSERSVVSTKRWRMILRVSV